MPPPTSAALVLLAALGIAVAYTDVRYRRIPNKLVLVTLISGLLLNTVFGGLSGLLTSLGGFALAFCLMLLLHVFGAMGAGDVKLFAAAGAVVGYKLVLPAFAAVLIIGFLLAIVTMLRARLVRSTAQNVAHFFLGLLPGWQLPRFDAAPGRATIPYGVAIILGSLITLVVFRG